MTSPHLTPREKAAVLWAEHVTKNTARSRDDVFAEVNKHFEPGEIVELTLMSGFFNLFNRLMDSLRVPIEPMGEVEKIKRSVHLEPERVRRYFETVARNWPRDFPQPSAQPSAEPEAQ